MTPSPQTPEYHADQVIKSLRGYVIRQAWIIEDRAIIADILREWADEVKSLEARITDLEQEKSNLRASLDDAGKVISPGYEFASDSYRPS